MAAQGVSALTEATLASTTTVRGVGLHTGATSAVTLHPAPEGTGRVLFVGGRSVPLLPGSVVDTRRCTAVGTGGVRVDTVEHLLAALGALGVTNAAIVVEGPEVPALDGSAAPWVDAIRECGIARQSAPARMWVLDAPVCAHVGASWVAAAPASDARFDCVCRFEHPLLGTQAVSVDATADAFVEYVAPARTFGLIEEVEALRAAGLALGGSLDNALVVYPDRYSSDLRLPDECARHKLLDMWGDLALLGAPVQAHVFGYRPGHYANARLAALIHGRGRLETVASTPSPPCERQGEPQ